MKSTYRIFLTQNHINTNQYDFEIDEKTIEDGIIKYILCK